MPSLNTLKDSIIPAEGIASLTIFHLYSLKRLWQVNYKPRVTQSGLASIRLVIADSKTITKIHVESPVKTKIISFNMIIFISEFNVQY